jgi:hypothetical protein
MMERDKQAFRQGFNTSRFRCDGSLITAKRPGIGQGTADPTYEDLARERWRESGWQGQFNVTRRYNGRYHTRFGFVADDT